MNELAMKEPDSASDMSLESNATQYVTFKVMDQLFGVDVLKVQDILKTDVIAFVPLAPPEVTGSINLRGRIVTVIDVRVCLGMPAQEIDEKNIGVTVEHDNDLYTLRVDQIGEVLDLPVSKREDIPNTLDAEWHKFASGVYQLEGELMVALDIDKLLRH
ncbi:MAG: chemotaxis protein CheW [Rhodospirillales bacterium]|nr:chemotaxis protein CheW [Rhodospirillales bacterium]